MRRGLGRRDLCRRFPGVLDIELNRQAGACAEINQGVEAEFPDSSAQQIVQARLSYAELRRGMGLR